MELLLLAIGIVILGYLGFVFLFPKAIPEDSESHTRSALRELMLSAQESERLSGESGADSIIKEEFQEENPLVKALYSLPFMPPLYRMQIQAGFHKSAFKTAIAMIALFFALAILFSSIGLGLAALPMALVVDYLLTRRFFARKVAKRNKAFVNLFPDVLDMIVRSVRSGFPITTAFKMVAENMESPVKEEFQQVVNEIAAGRTINETLNRLAARINEPDINFFVVVLSVQQETGGNLAEVVSNLSNIIRKRKHLRMKIQAMTSEGRATGIVLGSLPFVVFLLLFFTKRDYVEPLWMDPTGQIISFTCFALLGICMLVVSKIINIDI